MDFFVDFIIRTFRFLIWEFICFRIGYAILFLISFGTYPDAEELGREREEYGEVFGMLEAPEHRFIGLVGLLFYIFIAVMIYFFKENHS